MTDVYGLTEYVKEMLALQLNTQTLPEEYYYQSLTLAAIDAVFSAQAQYPSVKRVVQRYANKYRLATYRNSKDSLPPQENQDIITNLISEMEQLGISYFAENVFENRSKTSGRLKAEILLDVLKELKLLNIQTFQDIQSWLSQPDKQHLFIEKITAVHGVGDATSRYMLMLAGDSQMVKPDTMILRFIRNALDKVLNPVEAVKLIQEVSRQLILDFPHMNPRLLDYLIWSWQRDQPASKNNNSTQKREFIDQVKEKYKSNTVKYSRKVKKLTIPQKTQLAMHRRYQPGKMLTSAQIKDDVLSDYPGTNRSSVMPSDYCCNISNDDPSSGAHHIFFYDKSIQKYMLLTHILTKVY